MAKYNADSGRVGWPSLGIMTAGVLLSGSTCAGAELELALQELDPGLGSAAVLATGTTPEARYMVQASSSPGTWADGQALLAHGIQTEFQASFAPGSSDQLFRVIHDPFVAADFGGPVQRFSLFSGPYPYQYADWLSEDTPSTAGYSISSDGTITHATLPGIGLMALDKRMSVGVGDLPVGGTLLNIGVRKGGSGFMTSDLEGDWQVFMLAVADAVGDWAGWFTSELSFTAGGGASWSAPLRSDGDTSLPDPFSVTVSPDGFISGIPGASWLMTLDKNTIVFGMDDGGDGSDLGLIVRKGGTNFATSDLEGRWRLFLVVAGDDPTDQFAGWLAAYLTFTADGTATWSGVQRSDGDNSAPGPMPFTVAPDGFVSGGPPGSTWLMSLDRNMITFVTPDGGEGVGLGVMLRN